MKEYLSILFFRILRHSFVFKYWYRKHMTEVLFDMELYDIEKDRIVESYKSRIKKFA